MGHTGQRDGAEPNRGAGQYAAAPAVATKYVLLALLAVAFFGDGRHFCEAKGLGPINTGFYRMLFSIPLLNTGLWQTAHLHVGRYPADCCWPLAGDVALREYRLWLCQLLLNANLLTQPRPFTVIPVSYFLFHERLPKLFLPGAAVTLAGVLLLVGGKASPVPDNYFGDFLALAAAFTLASCLLPTDCAIALRAA